MSWPETLGKVGRLVPVFVLGFLIGGQHGTRLGLRNELEVTTTRLSPDETHRARVVEVNPTAAGDRQTAVFVDILTRRKDYLVLSSGWDAMGRPAGTERLVWSRDGTKFLLVGRHFFVADDLMLDSGDEAYLLHDVETRECWVNSDRNHAFPPLTAARLAGIEFTEPVVLRPRAKVDPDSPGKRE